MASIPVRLTRPAAQPGRFPRAYLALAAVLTAARAVLAPHRVSLAKLWDMPLAVLGTGCVDFAAFHWHVLGWLVTGASLWIWNEILADDTPSGLT